MYHYLMHQSEGSFSDTENSYKSRLYSIYLPQWDGGLSWALLFIFICSSFILNASIRRKLFWYGKLVQSQAGTRFAYPRGIEGWVGLYCLSSYVFAMYLTRQLGGRFANVDNSTKDSRVKRFCKTINQFRLCEVTHFTVFACSHSWYTFQNLI